MEKLISAVTTAAAAVNAASQALEDLDDDAWEGLFGGVSATDPSGDWGDTIKPLNPSHFDTFQSQLEEMRAALERAQAAAQASPYYTTRNSPGRPDADWKTGAIAGVIELFELLDLVDDVKMTENNPLHRVTNIVIAEMAGIDDIIGKTTLFRVVRAYKSGSKC
jgi:hypothetical protein